MVSKLKAEVEYIEQQWEKSTFEIKKNILVQCQVICLDADFGKVGLDKHVVNGRIEVVLDDEEEGNVEDPRAEQTNPTIES